MKGKMQLRINIDLHTLKAAHVDLEEKKTI